MKNPSNSFPFLPFPTSLSFPFPFQRARELCLVGGALGTYARTDLVSTERRSTGTSRPETAVPRCGEGASDPGRNEPGRGTSSPTRPSETPGSARERSRHGTRSEESVRTTHERVGRAETARGCAPIQLPFLPFPTSLSNFPFLSSVSGSSAESAELSARTGRTPDQGPSKARACRISEASPSSTVSVSAFS